MNKLWYSSFKEANRGESMFGRLIFETDETLYQAYTIDQKINMRSEMRLKCRPLRWVELEAWAKRSK